MDPRHTKRLKINQEQIRYLQKGQSTNDSTSDGRYARRAVRHFNSLYKCWNGLFGPFILDIGRETKSDGVVRSLV